MAGPVALALPRAAPPQVHFQVVASAQSLTGMSDEPAIGAPRSGDQVRNLKRLDCDEISPVIRGAGVGTGTE